MMDRGSRVIRSSLAFGLLAAVWAVSSEPSASAHGGHKHAPASAKRLANPLAATAENIDGGRTLYGQHCASCHGEDGQAKTNIASAMKTKPTDLTGKDMHGLTEGEIYWVVTHGIRKSGMPAAKTKLSDRGRWQTVLYVKRLMGEHQHATGDQGSGVAETGQHDHHSHEQKANPPSSPATQPQSTKTPDAHSQHQPPSVPAQSKQSEANPPDAAPLHQHHQGQTQTEQAKSSGGQMATDTHAGHGQHANHDMPDASSSESDAHAEHDMTSMMATVTGGPFRSMHALGSGTSLQPASTPMSAWHFRPGEWMLMLHGNLIVGFNHQGGLRGVGKAESVNWVMLMAERNLGFGGHGRLMLRGMLSAEPLTAPHGGFPLLFQTGETYRGRSIIDAQHPHDLFMELAASYTVPLSEGVSFQVYGGPVAEPALGPVAFMHRASAMENPAAPLGHHWQDSTHISRGVVTGALNVGRFEFEGSVFHGREPDEDRVGIDLGPLDSYSFRAWLTPTPNWTVQFSYGYLTQPEVIHQGDLKRSTGSVAYNRPLATGNWASTLIWGRNSEPQHGISNSYLFESTVNFRRKNHVYLRVELIDKQGLLGDNVFGRTGLICLRVGSQNIQAVEARRLGWPPGAEIVGPPGVIVCQPKGVLAPSEGQSALREGSVAQVSLPTAVSTRVFSIKSIVAQY